MGSRIGKLYVSGVHVKFGKVMRDIDSKKKTVKVKGPWVNGVQSVKEIPLEEWTSYTPLNTRVKGEWFRVVGW